jgi:MarR family transcriptional regulator, lower aerobic nicotinate degradation pathway regulator
MTNATASVLPDSLAHWPGYLMAFVADEAVARFERELSELGVRTRHAEVLVVIDAEGPMSQRQLGRRLHIDKSQMVIVVDELERRGLAERRRRESDRRANAIHLTQAGADALSKIRACADRENETLFGSLQDGEREQLVALLRRIAEMYVTLSNARAKPREPGR